MTDDTTIPPHRTPSRQAEYKRRYRAKPETKVKEAEYSKKYYALNREQILRSAREYNARPENKKKQRERKRSAEYRAWCAEYDRQWRPKNKEKVKGYRLKQRAKREAEYTAIAGRPKPEVCDICAQKVGNIVFDHCHNKGHFRGFLCDRCNTVLGLAEDNASLLVAMSAYLRRTQHGTLQQFTLSGV